MPHAIFSISDEATSWDDDDDVGLESFSETDVNSVSGADERDSFDGSLAHQSSDAAFDTQPRLIDDDAEVDAASIRKDKASGPPVLGMSKQSNRSPSTPALVAIHNQVTPHYPHGPKPHDGGPSAPLTARPPHARALGSEFELLDEDDWRDAESEGPLDDRPDADGPAAPGSPVPKRRQPLAADRPPPAFPSLSPSDAHATSLRSSSGSHRK